MGPGGRFWGGGRAGLTGRRGAADETDTPRRVPFMSHFAPKPHVSPALAHLRHGVTTCALALAFFATLQMLVFGFVHFTEVRWVDEKIPAPSPALRVVGGGQTNVAAAKEPGQEPARVDDEPLRVLGRAD